MPTLLARTSLVSLFPLILASLVGSYSARAQSPIGLDPCTGGTLYYIAYPDTVTNAQDARFADRRRSEFFFYIYSPVNQKVKVGRANGASSSKTITGGQILEFDTREIAVPLISVRNAPQSNVLKVESESPVVVYAYMASPFGCAAFTPIPVESWGTQYFAATWPGEYVRDVYPAGENNFDATVKVAAPAEIVVIAAYDNTQLRITPTASLASCANCQTVRLNTGEAYLVQSYVDLTDTTDRIQGDIAGSSISANKPIGVITANARSWHEPFPGGSLAANSYKDMTAEWLTPVEQHGREFVFTPTWDDYRQRPNVSPVRENEYVRIYATDSNATDVTLQSEGGESRIATAIKGGEFADERLERIDQAYFYSTTRPAQALQSPRPTTEFNATTSGNDFSPVGYKSTGTYAVEMTPREQWTSFAPFKGPSYPSGMKHYINLVADSADQFNVYYRSGSDTLQPFPFTRGVIPTPSGSLVWGQMVVNPGLNYTIEGKSGARFGGFVYGGIRGYELYRPGVAKDGDEKENSTAAAHPAEYEEELAMMYAYPLASSSCALGLTDKYKVNIEQNCEEAAITIDAENENPSGLKFIRLLNHPDSTFNTRLEFIEPDSALAFREKNVANAAIRLVAIDPLQDARGVVEFKDRTREGKVQRVRFNYEAERVDIVPAEGLDFGSLTLNFAAGEREVTITNPLDKDVVVKQLKLFFGNQEFVIVRVEPNFDWKSGKDSIILKSKESMKVWIDITPRDENRIYHDSLVVILGCVQVSVPLDAATVQPCLYVNDLDFKILAPNESKTLPLEICNIGKGRVTFHDSTSRGGGDIISWLLKEFRVDRADIEKLRNTVLNANECLTINVTFTSPVTGTFRTVGRFWGSTRDCRDTSIWRAVVKTFGPNLTPYHWGARWVTSRNACTKNDTVQYIEGIAPDYKGGVVTIGNDGSGPFTVLGLEIINDDPSDPADIFVIDNPGNVVNGKRINPGMSENVIVAFRPEIEKEYSAVIRLNYRIDGEDGFIDEALTGSGIESCLQVNDLTIIADSMVTPPKGTRPLLLRSTGGRAVTVTGISLSGIDVPDFVYEGGFPALPIVIPPGESYPLNLTFLPSTLPVGERRAQLVVEGDYAYVDCPGSCSDSLAELTGKLGTLTVAGEESLAGYAMRSVTPNPFSREVQIEFELGQTGETRVEVFDPTGQSVGVLLEARLTKGVHSVNWDGWGLSSGEYFIRITSGAWSTSQQVLFVR
ncbi:MAG: T9SS type A sorting domain-containing protein [Ignavibacteriae bacterium]|nr:T9SS type A sorting domain-containing protein [Ignavibacteriota bacterium]MCB9215023.1 T9SS type A sorting domain-containing protein [Ignavibacteria bacterium]